MNDEEASKLIESIDLKFTSSNSVSVDRVAISADEWKALKELINMS